MRQILILAAAVLLVGGYVARFADQAVVHPAAQAAAVQPAYEPRPPGGISISWSTPASRW